MQIINLNKLKFIIEPLNNYLASKIKGLTPKYSALFKHSKIYMMATKPATKLKLIEKDGNIKVEAFQLEKLVASFSICTMKLAEFLINDLGNDKKEEFQNNIPESGMSLNFKFAIGDTNTIVIKLLDKNDSIINDFYLTLEQLIWRDTTLYHVIYDKDISQYPFIDKFEYNQDAYTYNLLYVGIATQNGSFERLVKKAHHARQKILSQEYPISKDARVTDELFLFFLAIDPLKITCYGIDDEIGDEIFNTTIELNPIYCDAEKALINNLKPKYNEVIYNNYPKSENGLYDSEYDGYSFHIGERIILKADEKTFIGNEFGDVGSAIVITGDEVSFI